jgi:Lysyl oxidase
MPSLVRRPLRPLALFVITLFLMSGLVLIPARDARSQAVGTLRVVVAKHEITLRHSGKRVYLNLGAYIAASGGDFELHIKRADYESPIVGAQVDPSTKVELRALSSDMLQGWNGLADFTTVIFRNDAGKVVARVRRDFCPNSWELQRVNDDGPELATYPTDCGAWSPFTKGMVWGLNNGWANSMTGYYGSPRIEVPDGHYEVTVRIAQRFADLFEISPDDASETLDVTVKKTESHHAPPARAPAPALSSTPHPSVPIVTDPDPSTVADLVALPTWSMRVRNVRGKSYLGFAVTPWNAGPAPLVVEGFRQPEEDVMDAYQYFYDASGDIVGRAPVGTMEYDRRRGHHHWHMLQFAEFTMVDLANAEVVRSKKQSFCLAPTDPIDLTVPGAKLREYGDGSFTQCGGEDALWVREVLQTGWGDTYYQSVGGQSFNVTNLPNGQYKVRVTVNPTGELYETSPDNNVAERLVTLRGRPGNRRVHVSPWFGIER